MWDTSAAAAEGCFSRRVCTCAYASALTPPQDGLLSYRPLSERECQLAPRTSFDLEIRPFQTLCWVALLRAQPFIPEEGHAPARPKASSKLHAKKQRGKYRSPDILETCRACVSAWHIPDLCCCDILLCRVYCHFLTACSFVASEQHAMISMVTSDMSRGSSWRSAPSFPSVHQQTTLRSTNLAEVVVVVVVVLALCLSLSLRRGLQVGKDTIVAV